MLIVRLTPHVKAKLRFALIEKLTLFVNTRLTARVKAILRIALIRLLVNKQPQAALTAEGL